MFILTKLGSLFHLIAVPIYISAAPGLAGSQTAYYIYSATGAASSCNVSFAGASSCGSSTSPEEATLGPYQPRLLQWILTPVRDLPNGYLIQAVVSCSCSTCAARACACIPVEAGSVLPAVGVASCRSVLPSGYLIQAVVSCPCRTSKVK